MSPAEFHNTNERIGQLERKLRRQNRVMIADAALAVATSLLFAQTPSNRTLEAEKFILRGPQGQELAIPFGDATGAALALYDGQHRARMMLATADTVNGKNKGLAVFRSDGKVGDSFGVSDNDDSYVGVLDSQGRTANLDVTKQGPVISLTEKGRPRTILTVNDEGPSISLHDEQGRPRADLELTDRGPRMRMWDSNSVVRAAVGIDKDDFPGITVSTGADPKKGSVVIGSDAKGGGVLITGPDGKSRSVMR